MAAAVCIRRLHPQLPVLESHPKALLCLLGISGYDGLTEWLTPVDIGLRREDERDAALGVLGAWAMIHDAPGWADLFPHEQDPILPVGAPIGYWMPRIAGGPAEDADRVVT
jgi:hypothetical protein